MVDTIEAAVGIYVGSFVLAVISGVFPLVNAELYVIGISVAGGSLPLALAIASIVAVGQMVSHAALFQAAVSVTRLSAKRRARFEQRIARARATVDRWGLGLPVLFASATLGVPPMIAVAPAAGVLGVRFRTFAGIGVLGRLLRFGALAVVAYSI